MEKYEQIEKEYRKVRNELNARPIKDREIMWWKIKKNPEILNWASDIKENGAVNAPEICDSILAYYKKDKEISKEIYEKLVREVYSKEQVARTKLHSNNTFLLRALSNTETVLSEDEKRFIENELNTTYHNRDEFDLRFGILSNPNWTDEEKENLIKKLYKDEKAFETQLMSWLNMIVYHKINFRKGNYTNQVSWAYQGMTNFKKTPKLSENDVLRGNTSDIANIYKNEKDRNTILELVDFYRKMLYFYKTLFLNKENPKVNIKGDK